MPDEHQTPEPGSSPAYLTSPPAPPEPPSLSAAPPDPAPPAEPPAHATSAPTEPAESGGGPQDALADEPAAPAGGVELTNPDAAGASEPGPEDALDPHVEQAGDYSDRVEDGAHLTHQALPDPPIEGPLSEPVPQNAAAIEHAANEPAEPAPDVAGEQAQQDAEQRGAEIQRAQEQPEG